MDWRGYFEEFSDIFIDGGTAKKIDDYNYYNSRDASYVGKDNNWLTINAGSSYPLYSERDTTKIYEKPYVTDWTIVNNKLHPIKTESFIEKARYIDVKNSNKYNITQTIAEVFEVFCVYEYTCDSNGYFKKFYYDDYGNLTTGKRVVFFNRAINTENPFILNYQHNLQNISRIIDSSEVYTKMYVNPVAADTLDTGYASIADTNLNPLLEDYILNFDYLYEIGSINDYQQSEINAFKVQIHKLNKQLVSLEEEYNDLVVTLNEKESLKAQAEASLASAQEQLVDYESLRDTEVTNSPVIRNSSNSYFVTMVPHTTLEIIQGQLRLEGINPATITGYASSKYENANGIKGQPLFQPSDLISVQNAPASAALLKDKWFITYDEFGFPATIFTSKENPLFQNSEIFGNNFNLATGAIIFLGLEYCPKNKYEVICQKFYSLIEAETNRISKYEKEIGSDEENNLSGLKGQIKVNEEQREKIVQEKNLLNFRLERVLGSALREGYWQPENYEDPGEGHNNVVSYLERPNDQNTTFIFDEEYFESEEKGYYYLNDFDIAKDNKTYYSYIDLSNIYSMIGQNNNKIADFSLNLLHPEYEWEIMSNGSLQANGKYYFLLDGKYYWFQLKENTYQKGDVLVLHTKNDIFEGNTLQAPFITVKNTSDYYLMSEGPLDTIPSLDEMTGNLTNSFMGLGQYLSTRHLFNNAGFCLSFLKVNNEIKPIALLQNLDIDYSRYKSVLCSFNKNETIEDYNLTIQSNNETKYPIVYPRLFLNDRNINHDSDNFKVMVTSNLKPLLKFEDYSVLLRKGKVYVTLKVTDTNSISNILEQPYNIIYQVSRANEMLYLDAQQVAKDSSKPKYSYEVTIANLPQEIKKIELGQLVYINDYTIDAIKESGYISGISLDLDQPSKDNITIANYKTKFEDLFSSISAQNEAMKQNQTAYNIAAACFTSSGEVEPSVLQSTLDNNNFAFNFSKSNVSLDDTGGLVLTNVEPYSNGVNGQLALRGGGLFCSNSINEDGARVWNTAITPEGINASYIKTGRLDTNLIRIYSGNTLAFQWNSTGLYAFKEIVEDNNEPKLDSSSYVKLNEEGLLYSNKGSDSLELGWNGLKIYGANGHLKLTSDEGLQILNNNNIPLLTFGKYQDDYGIFFLDNEGNPTLQATQDGQLLLKGDLYLGEVFDGTSTNYAVLRGNPDQSLEGEDFYFMVGQNLGEYGYPEYNTLWIGGDGSIFAKSITCWGDYSAENAAVLSTFSESDPYTNTIQATAIIADEFLYTAEFQADEAVLGNTRVDNVTIPTGGTVTFINGAKKAIVSFDGEKINVVYE